MTRILRYLLLGDGGRDRALIPVLEWALRRAQPEIGLESGGFCKRAGPVAPAIAKVIDRYDPDLLFVHRDAEAVPLADRRAEIPGADGRVVRVVPVRMTEAWLLCDETAIRRAAGNPHGRERLGLPDPRRLERLADPKGELERVTLAASGLSGRKRKRMQRDEAAFAERVASLTEDFSPLDVLPAFRAFRQELDARLREWVAGASG